MHSGRNYWKGESGTPEFSNSYSFRLAGWIQKGLAHKSSGLVPAATLSTKKANPCKHGTLIPAVHPTLRMLAWARTNRPTTDILLWGLGVSLSAGTLPEPVGAIQSKSNRKNSLAHLRICETTGRRSFNDSASFLAWKNRKPPGRTWKNPTPFCKWPAGRSNRSLGLLRPELP